MGAKHKAGRAPGLKETEMMLWDESGLKSAKESKSLEGSINL